MGHNSSREERAVSGKETPVSGVRLRRLKARAASTGYDAHKRTFRLISVALVGAMLVITLVLMMPATHVRASDDYVFGSEDVTTGNSYDSANRDLEDAQYQRLVEEDTYEDDNFSGSSENVVTGTGGDGSFPTALDTDDATRRSYTEEDTGGGGGTPYELYLYPNGAGTNTQWDTVYGASTHWEAVDETTEGGDDGTTYVETGTDSDLDDFTLTDMSEPASGYTLDVQAFVVHYKAAPQPCSFVLWGLIDGTWYPSASGVSPVNGVYTNTSGTMWTLNLKTSSEWTYTSVNSIQLRIAATDASPDLRVTQVGLRVIVNFTGGSNYELDAQITYSSVTSSSQTTGFMVYCQGYRSGSEDFYVQAWDYVGTDWNTKDTIDQGSDTDFNFALTTDERDAGGEEVKLRILGATESGDTTQDVVYFDVLKVNRIERGYALDISMTASSVPQYGNVTLRIKGYTSPGETFDVSAWNYTSSGWDADVLSLSDTSNTMNTYDLNETHHRSGTEVKIRWEDATAASSDTVRDTYYLDVAFVTHVHADPTITVYGDTGPVNVGSPVTFWCNYTDADNEAPEYVRVVIAATPYDMTKNDSGDTSYHNGVNYTYSTSALSGGEHSYHFAVDDANSDEVTTTPDTVVINRAPTLTLSGVVPATGNNGDTFYFYCNYTDLDNNAPDYIEVVISSTPYTMTKNDSGDTSYDNGVNYSYSKVMAGGDHSYYFRTADYLSSEVSTTPENLNVNNKPTLGSYSIEPAGTLYPTTLVYFNVTFTDLDGDLPSVIKWRESEGAVQNITMTQVDAGDSDTTDGKEYTTSLYLSHGSHEYDFYASDGMGSVSGGDDTAVIDNRAPTIDDTPDTTTTYRSTYWEWAVEASDLDNDDIGYEEQDNCTFTLSIDPDTGLLSGTTNTDLGWYDITVYANDSYGGSDSYNFQLYVVNRAPVITSSGNTTQALGTYMAYHVTYTDADADAVTVEFSSNCTDLALSNEWINGTMTTEGWYWCKQWCNDSFGGSDLEEWQVTVGNEAPYFTSTPITSWQNNSFYSYDANATDPNPGSTIEYGLITNCTDLSVHSTYGFVNGTLSLVGSYYVNVTASDGSLVSYQNFSLQCLNTAPEITTSPGTTGDLGVQYDYDADATDVNGDTLVWAFGTHPSWLGIDDETGEITGTPTAAGEFTVNISCYDGYAYDWQQWQLTISDGEEEPEAEPAPYEPGGGGSGAAPDALFIYYIQGNKLIVVSESTGDILRYQWTFGDGTGSNMPSAEHFYAFEGDYRVTLTVYGVGGIFDAAYADITISSSPDLWFQKGEAGYEVVIAGDTAVEIPIWVFGVVGGLLVISWRFNKTTVLKVMSPRVRLFMGLVLFAVVAVFYGVLT